jgi:ceramide glucosyltransferase
MKEFPKADAQLAVCGSIQGTNLKVCTLAALEERATHEILIVSDADVRVPPDLLVNLVAALQSPGIGLVNCFYRLANPATLAMRWEAVCINADFWSQVLQSRSLKPLDFALGAVMATRRGELQKIGGFRALLDCLADDYQLGRRIARRGQRIALSSVVVECWSAPMGWAEVWRHQLRWARTIRVCQPAPYFFSLLSNATLWPLVWLAAWPSAPVLGCVLACVLVRASSALNLQRILAGARAGNQAATPAPLAWRDGWLVWLKDLLQVAVWALAFAGNRIEWRGERMRLRRDGTLVRDGQ